MTRFSALFAFSAVIILISGCGKSDETIRMEMAEWAKIDSVHVADMAFLKELMVTDKELETALKVHDELLSKLKKDESYHSGLDLIGAREKVQAAITAMNEVMPKLAQPDYSELKHDEVVKILEEQKSALDQVSSQMKEASDIAKSALKAHDNWAADHAGRKK